MKDQMKARLKELQAEYQKGQEQLATLEQEATNVRNAMLRIGGAIQVLQELLQEELDPAVNGVLTKATSD